SRMVGAVHSATDALNSLQGAAGIAGQVLAFIADGVSGVIQAFQALPGPIQAIIGGVTAAIAAWGMFRQAIAGVTAAMRLMGLGAFAAAFSPLGLAITGVALAGGYLVKSFMDQKRAAEEYRTSIDNLENALERLRRQGDESLANLGDTLKNQVNDLDSQMDGLITKLEEDFFGKIFKLRTGEDFDFHDLNANSTQALQEMIEIRNNYEDEFNKLVESF